MAKFEASIIKEGDFMTFRIFKRIRRFERKKLLESNTLLPSNILHTNPLDFPKNSNCRINLLFKARGLKLGHFGVFDALFPFLAFF